MNKQKLRSHIPQHLTNLRKAANLSQDDVAKAIGINRSAYAAYEEGRATPSLSILIELKRIYGYNTIDALLGIGDLVGLSRQQKAMGGGDADGLIEMYQLAPPSIRQAVNVLLGVK